jgi:hypothetical protein
VRQSGGSEDQAEREEMKSSEPHGFAAVLAYFSPGASRSLGGCVPA